MRGAAAEDIEVGVVSLHKPMAQIRFAATETAIVIQWKR
jgi:hypothetical protein